MHEDTNVRTTIELPEAQVEALERFCQREGVSQAEAICRAVDQLVANGAADEREQARQAAFGLWRGRQPDGRGYVEALREEWER